MTEPEEFIEYGYVSEWPDGFRCAVSPLGTDRERALGYFRTYKPAPSETRLVFVSRRVTYTQWTDEETSSG